MADALALSFSLFAIVGSSGDARPSATVKRSRMVHAARKRACTFKRDGEGAHARVSARACLQAIARVLPQAHDSTARFVSVRLAPDPPR
eukprot:1291605-Pleurochrysis_carterae.AAC.1